MNFFFIFYFIFFALASILCSEAEQFEQFWLRTSQGTILSTFIEIRPVVTEEMLFEDFFFLLILALVAILCSGEEQFEQFW